MTRLAIIAIACALAGAICAYASAHVWAQVMTQVRPVPTKTKVIILPFGRSVTRRV